jgi:hypothetical protein
MSHLCISPIQTHGTGNEVETPLKKKKKKKKNERKRVNFQLRSEDEQCARSNLTKDKITKGSCI